MLLNRFQLLAFAAALFLAACVSRAPTIQMGLQPKYEAVNPSRILAVPPFIVPDPTRQVSVDVSAVESGNMTAHIEEAVLKAFTDQPAINGVSFFRVRKEIGKSNLITNLDREMSQIAKRLVSREAQDQTSFSKDCIQRRNFVEFYVYCVSPSKSWKDFLNALSAKIYNADSALIVVVTEAEKKEVDGQYESRAGVAALLVDTNNGNLIWGRVVNDFARSTQGNKVFPEWSAMIPSMLGEGFWAHFPGRKLKQ